MGNELIVVETGVIQCEHGGKVILKSTVPNHVIDSKKPLYHLDLLDAKISGCPKKSPCQNVASISSAMTETNSANNGKNYLLRTDGAKTDKGASLVLINPGQTNTKISTPPSTKATDVTIKALEGAKLDTKENMKKEKYRIFPLRRGNKSIKALRGARNFKVHKDFFSINNGTYIKDKVVTYTDAYLYVTHDSKTTEYKVINRGDIFNPRILDVQFKDTTTNILRRHIPFYEESGDLKFVYSNIKLQQADLAKFTAEDITIESKKNSCVFHHKNFSKKIEHTTKEFKEYIYSKQDIKKYSKTRSYISTVVYLDDPIGQVEDLYNDYEYSYNYHYGYNKPIIDDLKDKNRYAYTIAELLDYFYINDSEQKTYEKQRDELKEQYIILADGLKEFGNYILDKDGDKIIGKNLASFIDYKVAKDYIDEVKFIDNDFFESVSPWFSSYDEEHFYLYANNTSYLYACKGFKGGRIFQNYLKIEGTGYKREEKPSDALAFVLFTIYFSKKHSSELDKYPDLKEAANKFFYLLKKATPLPQINDKAKEEIQEKLSTQVGFKNAIEGNKSLLSEYRSLDDKLEDIAFDSKGETCSFTSLKTAQQIAPEVYYNKKIKTPKEQLKNISKALSSSELNSTLKNYTDIKDSQVNTKYDYYFYLMNLSYMLINPRVKLDEETQKLSLFNKQYKEITNLLLFISKELQTLDEELALKLHAKDIKLLYLNSLYSLIAEAKLSKGARASGVENFLNNFHEKVTANKEDTSKLLSQDYDEELKLKSESQSLHETLKKLDGVSSYVAKFEANEYDDMSGKGSKTKLADDMDKLKNSKAYKQLLTSTKVLSFFVAAGNIAEFIKGKESIKLNNIVNLSEDILNVSSTVAEFASKADHHLEQKVGQRVSKFNIPSSMDELVQVNKVAPASSMRVIARFGLIPVMLNATIELSEINTDENMEYFIAVAAKNAIYFAMLFTPATVGIGVIVLSAALLELGWALVKDSIENSKLELFIDNSLLYQDPYVVLRRGSGKLHARILLSVVNTSSKSFLVSGKKVQGSQIHSFDTVSKIQEFIADNYDEHSLLLDAALINEVSQLRSILYGFTITPKNEYHTIDLKYGYANRGIEIHPKSNHTVKLSSSLKSSAEHIYLSYLNVGDDGKRIYKKLDVNTEYDITSHLISQQRFANLLDSINFDAKSYREKVIWVGSSSQTRTFEDMLKDIYMLVVTPETTLRYNIIYNLEYKLADTHINIKEIQTTHLSEEDMKEIQG